jgi:hypothetical protein
MLASFPFFPATTTGAPCVYIDVMKTHVIGVTVEVDGNPVEIGNGETLSVVPEDTLDITLSTDDVEVESVMLTASNAKMTIKLLNKEDKEVVSDLTHKQAFLA